MWDGLCTVDHRHSLGTPLGTPSVADDVVVYVHPPLQTASVITIDDYQYQSISLGTVDSAVVCRVDWRLLRSSGGLRQDTSRKSHYPDLQVTKAYAGGTAFTR